MVLFGEPGSIGDQVKGAVFVLRSAPVDASADCLRGNVAGTGDRQDLRKLGGVEPSELRLHPAPTKESVSKLVVVSRGTERGGWRKDPGKSGPPHP